MINPDKNAGTKDTTFSVNSEGNIVIAYGGFEDKDDHVTRYCKVMI